MCQVLHAFLKSRRLLHLFALQFLCKCGWFLCENLAVCVRILLFLCVCESYCLLTSYPRLVFMIGETESLCQRTCQRSCQRLCQIFHQKFRAPRDHKNRLVFGAGRFPCCGDAWFESRFLKYPLENMMRIIMSHSPSIIIGALYGLLVHFFQHRTTKLSHSKVIEI